MDVPRRATRVGMLAAVFAVGGGFVAGVASADSDAPSPGGRATRPGVERSIPGVERSIQAVERSIQGAPSNAVSRARGGKPSRRVDAVGPRSRAADRSWQHVRVVVPNAAAASPVGVTSPAVRDTRAAAGSVISAPAAAVAAASPVAATPIRELLLLTFTAAVQIVAVQALSAVIIAPPSPLTVTPSLNLDGFAIVPASPKKVTSLYGRWSYTPGGLSLIQGEQQFAVIDPDGGESVGVFDAVVSTGLGYDYVELLVTSNDGNNVGTGPGEVPPVGSLISTLRLGRFEIAYAAMPSPAGDLASLTFRTPVGQVRIPVAFDAAAGIADHTVDNRPMNLGNGYSIAPTDPSGETITGVSGILPLFTTVQGHQEFGVYNSDGQLVGSFDGVFTTTADFFGTYTQAVLVTAAGGADVGTDVGQVPPVGSVFNVIYRGGDDNYFLYSSLPSPSGTVVSLLQSQQGEVRNVRPTLINASEQPPVPSASTPGGYRFVPVSVLQPVGVNGLPPREVQVQGYQQFDVVDPDGNRVGSVDADVTRQWDLFGIHSEVILVTSVVAGTPGTGPGDVPPVGSVFNFVYAGKGRFGSVHAVVASPTGGVASRKILTPLGDIVLPSIPSKPAEQADVSFVNSAG